jgi:hypothetical protein
MRDPQFIRVILHSIGENYAGTFFLCRGHSSLPVGKSFPHNTMQHQHPRKCASKAFSFWYIFSTVSTDQTKATSPLPRNMTGQHLHQKKIRFFGEIAPSDS